MNAESNANTAAEFKKTAKKATAKKNNTGPKKTVGKARRQQSGVATLSNPGFRRLARKGGVKRISNESFDAGRQLLDEFVNNIIKDAVLMSESANRKTVTAGDVSFALKRNGQTLYGYN